MTQLQQYQVIKRDGRIANFDATRISSAITKAFNAIGHNEPNLNEYINDLTVKVIDSLLPHLKAFNKINIEDIQNHVELILMQSGDHKVAREYVLYRETHAQLRAASLVHHVQVMGADGILQSLDKTRLEALVKESCLGLDSVKPELVVSESIKNFFDGITNEEMNRVMVMTTRTLIEKDPNYTYVAARLLLDSMRTDAFKVVGQGKLPLTALASEMSSLYPLYFKQYIQTAVDYELLNPAVLTFDLDKIATALIPEHDSTFTYLGLQTLFDRYFLHWNSTRFELPQAFFMRVAMGLSLNEANREERAIEFYKVLSSFDSMCSTPTLFNSATLHSQLSSCYLTTIPDDLSDIFKAIHDNALLSKFAGGIGNDWTNVRAMGSRIKGTNGKSQGVVPFMKVANDTLVAVNQCFAPDTLIYTANGVKPIKDIVKGDLVLGQRGEYREVLETLDYVDCQNPMVKIKVKHSILPLKVSNQHPFWAISTDKSIDKTLKGLAKGTIKPDWIDAGNLKKGDYVAQVIPKEISIVEGFNEDDARLYGIMLRCAPNSKTDFVWGVSHSTFVENYLNQRQIHHWLDNQNQIRWASGRALPFSVDDLYNNDGVKFIARRFNHLPTTQTLALIQGLLETDCQSKEVNFVHTSQHLIEGLRYQCLRLGIPVAGQYNEATKAYNLQIPVISSLGESKPTIRNNWFEYNGWLFIRIVSVEKCDSLPVIYDLKVEGDESYMTTTALVHNGGRRKGSGCGYLETWHLDIEEFLELRKNTGDERRRTHDMNTANWIPDLFMMRVQQNADWTLFSPDETPDLHDLYGKPFEVAYLDYESKAANGEIKNFKKLSAVSLWRKMLTMLFETGHPWHCFTSDTKIAVADGRSPITIKELADAGQPFPVYSAREVLKVESQRAWIEEIKIATAFKTGVRQIVQVHLDDGSTFKCTEDHLLALKEGGYIRTDKAVGQSLVGLHTNPKVARIEPLQAFEDVYDLTVEDNHNFFIVTQETDKYNSGVLVHNCFKDPCNMRSPQQHVGVVHSSNLCCIAADQRVVTEKGLLTIGELYKLGGKNKVVGLDGVYNASEMLLPRPNAPMVCINTKEGYTHKVTPDHKVWVKDTGWVEAQFLKPNDKLLIQQLEGLWGTKHNPKLSYLMGLIAGDGAFHKHGSAFIDIWEHDFKYLQPIEEIVHSLLESNTVLNSISTNTPKFNINIKQKRARLCSTPLYLMLEQEGFTPETKLQVPQLVWQGDRETVSEYLKGLYQTDGNVTVSNETTSLVVTSSNLEFIKELQILWANFGVKTSINKLRDHELKAMPDGKGGLKEYWCKPTYRLLITSIRGCQIAEEITQFATNKPSDNAKIYLANLAKVGYQQKLYATFTGLTELPNEDAYCLTVDSDAHAWTVNGLITKNTEITLNTSKEECGVCNLGSINLPAHIDENGLNVGKLAQTVRTAMRMLDNVIDINFYPIPQAQNSNLKHRPVGLGVMGFQDALYKLRIPYASQQAVDFADKSMELISYYAIEASMNLAKERGRYSSFEGSLWSKGILPLDSLKEFADYRGESNLYVNMDSTLDWNTLREQVKKFGMRNSNCMAIAPTATISNICGVTQSIEPMFQNLFVKSNLSGEFTVINHYLVNDLKRIGLWNDKMVNDLKYFDGSVQNISQIPQNLKDIYATAFEIDSTWLIEAASRRQKWIDQAQSLNLYMKEPSGSKLDNLYRLAWLRGLKTTYYLRSLGATHVEKNTVKSSATELPRNLLGIQLNNLPTVKACLIDDPECESCQ